MHRTFGPVTALASSAEETRGTAEPVPRRVRPPVILSLSGIKTRRIAVARTDR